MRSAAGLLVAAVLLLAAAPAEGQAAAASVELREVIASVGGTCEWNPLRSSGVILVGEDRISFQVDTPFVLVNWQDRVPIPAPVRRDGGVWFTTEAVAAVSDAVERARAQRAVAGQRIAGIILDAGHGGVDPGGVGEYLRDGRKVPLMEKDVVLKIAGFLGELLGAAYPDKDVEFMRTEDVKVELEERPKVANRLLESTDGTVLYVSIHANWSYNGKATGFEVWRLPPTYRRTVLETSAVPESDPEAVPVLNNMLEVEILQQSVLLGQDILRGLDATIGAVSPDRGLKEEEWVVVRSSKMPAVLVEVGYVSNPEEAARLVDDAYLHQVAQGLYAGILAFVARFERGGGGAASPRQ